MKIILSGGGTGGHIYPAIAIADVLKQYDPATAILFVGASGKMEMHKVPEAGYPIVGLGIRGFQRRQVLQKVGHKQKLFISWVGLRGAVPIVFATYPLLEGIDKSDVIFHIVFFIVLTSILFQGTTLHPLAKWLQLEAKLSAKKARAISLSEDVKSEVLELEVANDSVAAGKRIVERGLSKSSLIVLISREKNYLTPRGDTVIEAGDKLMVMTDDKQDIKELKACLGMSH